MSKSATAPNRLKTACEPGPPYTFTNTGYSIVSSKSGGRISFACRPANHLSASKQLQLQSWSYPLQRESHLHIALPHLSLEWTELLRTEPLAAAVSALMAQNQTSPGVLRLELRFVRETVEGPSQKPARAVQWTVVKKCSHFRSHRPVRS